MTYPLYPGACVERALGIWAPRSTPVADSLQPTAGFPNSGGYVSGQPDAAVNTIAYTPKDATVQEILWHVASSSEPAIQRPPIISGSHMLWCGKYDANWVVKAGYPNLIDQILYIDTGAHAGPYYLMFDGNLSSETDYDWMTIIGGGDHVRDPLGNTRAYFDALWRGGSGGPTGHSDMLVSFSGNLVGGSFPALGQRERRSGAPLTGRYTIGPIDADHRAIYIYFRSDDLYSSEDGQWPQGNGIQLDNIETSDNGAIYTEQIPAGGVDAYHGNIVVGPPASPIVSCRVFPGIGTYWSLAPGTALPTAAFCAPQEMASSNLMFRAGDPTTNKGVPLEEDWVVSCAFPVPPGTSAVIATWDSYDDSRTCGYDFWFRCYRDGGWGDWLWRQAGDWQDNGAWLRIGAELDEAVYADSVQVAWSFGCGQNPDGSSVPALVDNPSLQLVSEAVLPRGPSFGLSWSRRDYASGPRTTFIDGTIRGVNCTVAPCWPGLRPNDDNWNDEDGADEVTIRMLTGLRSHGSGINWRKGGGSVGNAWASPDRSGYNPAYDVPRTIFRLFDPSTLTWGPWDSMECVAKVLISDLDGVGGAPPETSVVNDEFLVDWPPPEKVAAGASLPGGFRINGVGAYAGLSWLPRGTRMQYYFKAVDINGGVTYNFYKEWTTVDDGELPNLPCHASPGCVGPKPPGIREWAVLPGVYPPGPPGSLLAGRTNTPILVLDDDYGQVSVALRALGVRADHNYHWPTRLGGGNGWPDQWEYPIIDSLAAWYRIIIVPTHERVTLGYGTNWRDLTAWLGKDTGTDRGDRCLYVDGNNINGTQRHMDLLGHSDATDQWSDAKMTPYPNIDDRFAAPGAGPALGAPGGLTYPIDGGCPDPLIDAPAMFDALTLGTWSPDWFNPSDLREDRNVAFYPNGEVAGISTHRELDIVHDKDRQKTLNYGFSTDNVREAGIPPSSSAYDNSGITARARILYKFLTGCRGARTSAPPDTGKCWPCPTPSGPFTLAQSEWASQQSGFQTEKYGPLYPIQAGMLASGIFADGAPESAPRANRIDGNYPNPFNPRTVIRFTSARAGKAEIRIFSVSGQLVRVLRSSAIEGENEVPWDAVGEDGRRVASGVYFYKILFPNLQSLRATSHLVIVR